MLEPNPSWIYTTPHSLSLWYGHVHLTEEYAVGQWLVIDRKTGKCLWDKKFRRPNTIFAIEGDVILASETRSDGPWTLAFGCYGIGLKTGEILWQWHGPGIRGGIVRLCDLIPDFTNGSRPSFISAEGANCLVSPQQVLNSKTGKPIPFEGDPLTLKKKALPESRANQFYLSKTLEISPGRELTYCTSFIQVGVTREVQIEFKLGNEWQWGPHQMGLKLGTNYYAWRLLDDNSLLMVVGEEPSTVPDPKHPPEKLYAIANPTRYHIILVDALTGRELQRIPVCPDKVTDCRIEDVDANGVLISFDTKRLAYYLFRAN